MTTTPIEIDPAIVEVARKAVAAQNSICRERLCPSLDCACGQFALVTLSAAAPLLVAWEREACAKIAQDWDEQNAVALEIAAAIRQRGGRA